MHQHKKIGVVIPIFNEEKFVAQVIETVPAFVDRIYAVNDASTDRTLEIIRLKAEQDSRVVVVNREENGGVGAAILSGHARALEDDLDIVAIMAGDGQMDPAWLVRIIGPVAGEKADYAKGNRFSRREYWQDMPRWRAFGNMILTFLTRCVTGYWSISDSQNGYTAISVSMLRKLDLSQIERGFAFEIDMLVKLRALGARVIDIPHPAIYCGQQSKIRYSTFIFNTSWILFKDFFWILKTRLKRA